MSGSTVTADLLYPPTVKLPPPGEAKRRYFIMEKVGDGYTSPAIQHEVTYDEGPLVSSVLENGLHAPAIDLDVPAYLLPSSTKGHSHLYIDVQMPWWKYRLLLWALKVAGVIEPGYYKASVARKSSFLRRPGVQKREIA